MRILLLLIFIAPYFCQSSDLLSIQMGQLKKEDHKHHILTLYKSDSQIILIKIHVSGNSNPFAEIIDNQLKIINRREIKLLTEKSKIDILKAFKRRNELLFLCKEYDSAEGHQIVIYKISTANFDQKPTKIILSTFSQNLKRALVNIDFSADTTNLAVHIDFDKNNQHIFLTFDSDLNQAYSIDFNQFSNHKKDDIHSFKINNKGNLFLQTYADQDYHFYNFRRNGELLSHLTLDPKLHQINSLKYISSLDSLLIYVGTVEDIAIENKINGVFMYSYNYYTAKTKYLTTSYFDSTTSRFFIHDEEHLKKGTRKKEVLSNGIFDLKLIHSIPRSDGGAGLICEQQKIKEETQTYFDAYGMMRTYTNVYYLYNNIAFININANGTIEWIKKIPKKQETANDHGTMSSFTKKLSNNYLYFLFNDHIQNGDNSNNPYANVQNFDFTRYTYALSAYRINIKGELEWQRCVTFKTGEVFTTPSLIYSISPNEIFFIGKNGKKERYGLMKEIP